MVIIVLMFYLSVLFGLHEFEWHLEVDLILIGQVGELLGRSLELLRFCLLSLVVLDIGFKLISIDQLLSSIILLCLFLIKLTKFVALGVLQVEVNDLRKDGRGNHLLAGVDWVVSIAVAAVAVEPWL